jgi:nitrogen fixation NifU-like protein
MAEAVQGRDDTAARHIAAALEALLREGRADTDPALERLRVFIGVRAFPSRIKCVTLPWRALLAALDKGAGENADG